MFAYPEGYIERIQKELYQWGEKYNPVMPHAPGLCCPECGGVRLGFGLDREWYQSIIGFSFALPTPKMGAAGVIILECPKCFSKFWVHILYESVRTVQAICPKWPKEADE
ncbi:MAG: hypothetical protein Q7R65_02645 [bacterium]|nr:hypothetical protein [bacterium]